MIYRNLSIRQAEAKCSGLSRDVCRQLFGKEGIEVAVRNVVGQVDGGLVKTYQNMTTAIDQSLELGGKEVVIFANQNGPGDGHAARLEFNFPSTRSDVFNARRPISHSLIDRSGIACRG